MECGSNIANGRESNIGPSTLSFANECEHNLANENLGVNAVPVCNGMPLEVKRDSQSGIRDEPCGGDWVGGGQVSLQTTSSTLYNEEEIPYNLVQEEESVVEEVEDEVINVGFDDEEAQSDGSKGNVGGVDANCNVH